MARELTFADATKILGDQSKELHLLDIALGGALTAATSLHSPALIIKMLKGAPVIVSHAGQLVNRANILLGRAKRHDRHEILVAAHAVIVIAAFFDYLGEAESLTKFFTINRGDKLKSVSPEDVKSSDLVSQLIVLEIPAPSPDEPYSSLHKKLGNLYTRMASNLLAFIQGLAHWDRISETDRDRLKNLLRSTRAEETSVFVQGAREKYSKLLRELSLTHIEFFAWVTSNELQAASIERKDSRHALGRVHTLLEQMAWYATKPGEIAQQLTAVQRAELGRNLIDIRDEEATQGLSIPTLIEGYIDPAFRVAVYSENSSKPSEDRWWQSKIVLREDLPRFLAGYLTTPRATELPLLVLGPPGAGKSLLTRVFAAQVPDSLFIPIRVELRHVSADASILRQIEYSIEETLHKSIPWATVSESITASGALPILFLDGFDELLQATGVSRSDYLERVKDFQRVESLQGRPVAVVVTSRTVVTAQASIPAGCTIIRLEPFNERRIRNWVAVWNRRNSAAPNSLNSHAVVVSELLIYRNLAEQPLLLLMLAIYKSTGHPLKPVGEKFNEAALYEGLLRLFIRREVSKRKSAEGAEPFQILQMVEQELDILATIAFSMFNRVKQAAYLSEIDHDIAALGTDAGNKQSVPTMLSQGHLAVGKFFFVHEARATGSTGEVALRSYEFLHATFGEYLVARKLVRELRTLGRIREAAISYAGTRSFVQGDDALIRVLLSFAPLTARRQVVEFIRQLLSRRSAEERTLLFTITREIFNASLQVNGQISYNSYRPVARDALAQQSLFAINILILHMMLGHYVFVDVLFNDGGDSLDSWRRMAQIWRACLKPTEWESIVANVHLVQIEEDHDYGEGCPSAPRFVLGLRGEEDLTETNTTFGYLSSKGRADSLSSMLVEAELLCDEKTVNVIRIAQALDNFDALSVLPIEDNPVLEGEYGYRPEYSAAASLVRLRVGDPEEPVRLERLFSAFSSLINEEISPIGGPGPSSMSAAAHELVVQLVAILRENPLIYDAGAAAKILRFAADRLEDFSGAFLLSLLEAVSFQVGRTMSKESQLDVMAVLSLVVMKLSESNDIAINVRCFAALSDSGLYSLFPSIDWESFIDREGLTDEEQEEVEDLIASDYRLAQRLYGAALDSERVAWFGSQQPMALDSLPDGILGRLPEDLVVRLVEGYLTLEESDSHYAHDILNRYELIRSQWRELLAD